VLPREYGGRATTADEEVVDVSNVPLRLPGEKTSLHRLVSAPEAAAVFAPSTVAAFAVSAA
jgi:hypothetical protein